MLNIASYRVGDIIIAPTWCKVSGSSRRSKISMVGIKKLSDKAEIYKIIAWTHSQSIHNPIYDVDSKYTVLEEQMYKTRGLFT